MQHLRNIVRMAYVYGIDLRDREYTPENAGECIKPFAESLTETNLDAVIVMVAALIGMREDSSEDQANDPAIMTDLWRYSIISGMDIYMHTQGGE